MLKFDKEKYLSMGKLVLSKRSELEEIAKKLYDRNVKSIFFTGVGGTTAEFTSMKKVIEQRTTLPVYCTNAAEMMLEGNTQLNKDSVIITGSKSGDTKETVAVAKWAQERGVPVVAITKEGAPLCDHVDYLCTMETSGVENTYLSFYYIVLKLLNLRGEFAEYDEFAKAMENVHESLIKVKEKFDPVAEKIAKATYKEPYQIWIGSGSIWGDIYMFTMCILEEMQWKRTKAVSSPEFFHGTLELVYDVTQVFLVKGVDKCRPLDERVEKFLDQYSDKHVVIDLADYKLEGVPDKFADIVSPMVTETILTGRLAPHIEHWTGHSLEFRRYYRQFDY